MHLVYVLSFVRIQANCLWHKSAWKETRTQKEIAQLSKQGRKFETLAHARYPLQCTPAWPLSKKININASRTSSAPALSRARPRPSSCRFWKLWILGFKRSLKDYFKDFSRLFQRETAERLERTLKSNKSRYEDGEGDIRDGEASSIFVFFFLPNFRKMFKNMFCHIFTFVMNSFLCLEEQCILT